MGFSDKIFEKAVHYVFKKFDDDGSGSLDVDEVTGLVNSILEKVGIDFKAEDDYVKYLIKAGDRDNDGEIGKDEIVDLMKTIIKQIEEGKANFGKGG